MTFCHVHYDVWKTEKSLCFKNVSVELYESSVVPLQFSFKVKLLSYKKNL